MLQNTLSRKNLLWIYGISFAFILINGIFLSFENYYFSLVPLVLLIVFLGLFALDKLLFVIIFLTPLSIPLSYLSRDFSFDMFLPTEPILFGILLLFIFKLLLEQQFDKKILLHPVSIAIFFHLLWMLVTSISSTMPAISFKFFIARLWFVVCFYLLCIQLFKKYKNIKRSYWLYIIPFMIVIIYTVVRLSQEGMVNQKAAHWVMNPFYNDHTSYGAILAMYLPLLFGMAVASDYSTNRKVFIWIACGLFIFALVFSYTRAAWVSVAGAVGVWLVITLKIKLRTIGLLTLILAGVFLYYQEDIFIQLEQNRQDSSTDFKEHIQSISNVSSDASNLERINRWKSALRMFQERPVLGFGPGTYMFQYAPYQFSHEKTIISTNAGDGGNAHSEYIGPMAESGFLGLITFLSVVITTIYTAWRVFAVQKGEKKMLAIATFLGLVTYFLHGLLNNFLDTDKASVPFWSFIAILVAFDLYHRDAINRNKTSE